MYDSEKSIINIPNLLRVEDTNPYILCIFNINHWQTQRGLTRVDKRCDRLGLKLVSPRIIIVKGSNFFYKSIYLYIINNK